MSRRYDDDDEFDEPGSDNEDNNNVVPGSVNPLQARLLAEKWTEDVLKDNAGVIKQQDLPYVTETLVQVGMFERPIGKLCCGINSNDDHYAITVKGYKRLMSDRIWGNIFLSKEKGALLKNTYDTFTQIDGGVFIKVLLVKKIRFSSGADEDDDDRHRGGGGSIAPSASRRYAKRE